MTDNEWDGGRYDDAAGFVTDYGDSVVDLLDPRPGERILDLGCGTGHLTATVADAVGSAGDVLGIDASGAQTTTVTLHLPREAYRDLEGVVNDLPAEEYRDLETGDAPHGKVEEYIYREYILTRRNMAEELTGSTDVEVTGSGDLVAESDTLL
ncbi:methyltransferase domain-containing protein [Halomicrobium katesii]|uniref:methyltransferase domain-containing protein n=1 Tax=Halomicrobium katesii TaxID=437163 RepID=UPI0003607661|nr:methyltransferase domain-containing protein [Halomicrobium katesii]